MGSAGTLSADDLAKVGLNKAVVRYNINCAYFVEATLTSSAVAIGNPAAISAVKVFASPDFSGRGAGPAAGCHRPGAFINGGGNGSEMVIRVASYVINIFLYPFE